MDYTQILGRPDPILSNLVIGHENAEVVGHRIAPVIPVLDRKGKYPHFDRSSMRRPPETRRAPHGRANETEFGWIWRDFDLEEHALSFVYEDKERQEYERIGDRMAAAQLFNMERDGVLHTEDQLKLGREENIANRLRDNSIPGEAVTSGGGTTGSVEGKWDEAATDIPTFARKARQEIYRKTRKIMNTVLLPWFAYDVAMWSPSMREYLGDSSPQFVDDAMLRRIFQVENVIIGAASIDIGMNPDPTVTPTFEDVWGNDVIFCYVAPNPAGRRTESFAYTFRYALNNNDTSGDSADQLAAAQGEDRSMPVMGWFEPGTHSHYREVSYEEKTHVISPDCGYVFREVLTGS